MKNKVLVTGATGASGSNVVKRLIELGIPVRAMVRKVDERSDALSALGAEIFAGDLRNFNSVSTALEDIDRAYFVYPVTEGLLEATAFFAQAAAEHHLSLIVNISQRTAVRDAPSLSAQAHWLAERLLDRSGVPVTHVQPTLFMEWLAYFAGEIKDHDRIITPFGDARYGTISSEDIGRVGAAILAHPEGHAGKTYPIYGPEELTQYEVADIMSDVLKRKITYVPIEPEAFGAIIKGSNSPIDTPYTIKHIVAIGHMFRSGAFRGMNNNVETITGLKPLSIKDFVTRNIAMFQ